MCYHLFNEFPSPHSGILFLFVKLEAVGQVELVPFPSPHSGILFLSDQKEKVIAAMDFLFPSPHSGILFLSVRRALGRNFIGFRPLIRGFFFYESIRN